MSSVFPVEMLGVLRIIVDIPMLSLGKWGKGLLGGEEAGCLARQRREESEKLFPHFFLLVPILPVGSGT